MFKETIAWFRSDPTAEFTAHDSKLHGLCNLRRTCTSYTFRARLGHRPRQLTNRTLTCKMPNSEKLNGRIGVASSGTSLFLATIEAVCVFVVSANGVAALVGSSGIVLAEGARVFHQATIRLPLLAIATAIALFNLWMLLNTWRLRRAPTAQWRLRPLAASGRRQIALIAALSILTLVLVGTELFVHHKLHGSAFAGTVPTQTLSHLEFLS
jgi:hypothetical protein